MEYRTRRIHPPVSLTSDLQVWPLGPEYGSMLWLLQSSQRQQQEGDKTDLSTAGYRFACRGNGLLQIGFLLEGEKSKNRLQSISITKLFQADHQPWATHA